MKVLNTSIFMTANDTVDEMVVKVLYEYDYCKSYLKICGVFKGSEDVTEILDFFPEIESALELEVIENA